MPHVHVKEMHQVSPRPKKNSFSADQWQLPDESRARTCYNCNVKQCSTCFQPKGQREFDRRSWQLEDKDPGRVCLACANGPRKKRHVDVHEPSLQAQKADR